MTVKFLHTSDWHIGKPFGRLEEAKAGVLRHARLKACDRLAVAARAGGAKQVLVAGDVFDRPTLSDRDLRAPLAQMAAHPDIEWHLIPGNHDPATPGGLWDRVQRLGLPPNVKLQLQSKAVEIAAGVWLLPSPLAAKAMSTDPTAWMDGAETPPEAIRVGLAHGSVQGFGSEQRASIEIAPDRPQRAGLSYLALGDWHGHKRIGPRIAYSGTPEPDGYLDNEPGLAVLVTIESAAAPPLIEPREIGEHRWIKRTIDIGRQTELDALERTIAELGPRALQALLAVEINGRATLAQERALRELLGNLEAKVMLLEPRLDGIVPAPETDDIDRLPEYVREMAKELSAEAQSGQSSERRAVAGKALRLLFELADVGAEARA